MRGRPTDWKYVEADTLSAMHQIMQFPTRSANVPALRTSGSSAKHLAIHGAKTTGMADANATAPHVRRNDRSHALLTRLKFPAPQL